MAASPNPFSPLQNPATGQLPQVGINVPAPGGLTPAAQNNNSDHNMFRLILIELRVMNNILAAGLNVTDDLDGWRNDPSLDPDLPCRSQ